MPTITGPKILHPSPMRYGRASRHGWLLPIVIVCAGVVLGVGAWLLTARLSDSTKPSAAPAATASQFSHDFMLPLDITALQFRLADAGYAILITRALDPLTRAAAADFFGSVAHPLTPLLARALDGTTFLGRGDSTSWNARFGLNRRTGMVERPLTGPEGQLDEYGNLR
jgi:hypothetical protein